MFNKDVAHVLVVAKRINKWIPIKYLVEYGFFLQNAIYLESKGYLHTKRHPEEGVMVKLTVMGYYEALNILYIVYNEKGILNGGA